MNAPAYLKTLEDLAMHLRRWRMMTAVAGCLFALLGIMVFFQTLTYLFPMREAIYVNIFMVMAVSYLVLIFVVVRKVLRDKPSLPTLANRVEQSNVELYDHLNCAVDISLKEKHIPSTIEKMVIVKADDALQNIDVYKVAGFDRDRKVALLVALLICLLLLGSLGQWPASENLFYALKDRMSGENTGLSVDPGSAEFPEHSDIGIRANIHRGLKQARIEYQTGDSLMEASMYSVNDRNDLADFTFFDATQAIDYRVVTPDFSSEWYHLTIYTLPGIDKVNWRIQPPAYTQLPETQVSDVKHFSMPEASRLVVEITASEDLSLEMITEKESIPLIYKDQLYVHQWQPAVSVVRADSKDDLVVHFLAQNKDSRTAETEPTSIDIFMDEKPVLEIVSPGVDISLTSEQTRILELYLADDYGLSKASLNVDVNGVKKNISLTLRKEEKDQRLQFPLNMKGFDVKPGDLISYYLTAIDNKQPQAQVAHSDLFFIEVGSKDESKESLLEDGDKIKADGDSKQLPIREYIVKTKQLVRQSFAIIDSPDEDTKDQTINDISQDTLVLKQDMNKVYVKTKASFKIIDNVDSGNLLLEAVHALERSIIELDRQAIQQSLDNTSIALQRLVQLDTLLRRLSAAKGKAKGNLGGEGEAGSSPSEADQASNHEKQLEKMNAIKEALQKTQALIEQQEHINIRIDNAQRSTLNSQLLLSEQQQELANKTADLSRNFYDSTGKLTVTAHLNRAEEQMQLSHEHLASKQVARARPEGARAMESLQMAAVNLKRELYALADKTLEQTKNRGEQLTQRQSSTQEKTRQGIGAEELQQEPLKPEQLKTEQQSLNSAINQYSTDIQQTSALLRGLNENISQSVDALNSSAKRKAMKTHQDRAVNALLYELFGQAEKEQQQIVESLQQTTAAIDGFQKLLAMDKGNVLASAVQDMDEVQKKMNQMSTQSLQAYARQLSGQLQNDKITESDYRLKEAVELFQDMGTRKDEEYLKEDMTWALQKTKPVLQAQLWQKAIRQSIQQAQDKSQLPQQYRQAVEDYFRRLAEEKK